MYSNSTLTIPYKLRALLTQLQIKVELKVTDRLFPGTAQSA